MGCKSCKNIQSSETHTINDICKSIQTDNTSNLNFFLKSLIRVSKNDREIIMNYELIPINNMRLNVLSYSLLIGSIKSFKFLYECCGCSIELMHQNFSKYGFLPLHYICERNFSELIKYYLPIYFRYLNPNSSITDKTLDLTSTSQRTRQPYTPIQLSVLKGSIVSLEILHNYYQVFANQLINIYSINEETGENCALLSVKSGFLPMVKLAHEKYKLDFNAKNNLGEGALLICAKYSSLCPDKGFNEVFVYLIEGVGIDPVIDYVEVLTELTNTDLVEYYERILLKKEIEVNKKEIDEIFGGRRLVKTMPSQNEKFHTDFRSILSSIEKFSAESIFNGENFNDNSFKVEE